ncbi:MAG: hypothetical protein KJO23_08230 [Bacteroidia bacterium]|nr:hypothetical protein [Bacteroidia bacterium]NNM23547.1 hypothetical protein [Flavobacteriaceae bacterium]
MIVKKDIFYRALLVVLFFIPTVFSSVEVTIALCVLLSSLLLFDLKFKFSNTFFNAVIPLVLILLIAGTGTFFFTHEPYDILKDFVYLVKPILMIVLGYYLIGKIADKEFIFKVIIYIAVVFAIYHIYRVTKYLSGFQFGITKIRSVGGKANYIELLALVFLHLKNRSRYYTLPAKYITIFKLILYVSFVFYFSRTMLFTFFILYFAINGYTKLTRKGVVYITAIIVALGILFASLQTMDLDRSSLGFEGFLYKIKNAPSEILTTKIDREDHSDLWDHWRGYEANRAFEQLGDTKHGLGYVFGKGLGSLVDLGFYAPLNRDKIRYIPVLHNGLAYIMFKAGFLGMFIYLLFLAYLYLQAYQQPLSDHVTFFNNAISGMGLYFFFTTLIITGIYNQGDTVTIALGAFIYLKHVHQKKALEL